MKEYILSNLKKVTEREFPYFTGSKAYLQYNNEDSILLMPAVNVHRDEGLDNFYDEIEKICVSLEE